jgi:hypothetical protein
MSYLGNPLNSVAFLTDQFSGNGSTTVFTMSVAPATTSSILVAISGVVQDPTTYSVVGTTLTFSAAPPGGTGNVSVRYLGIPASGVTTTAYRTVTDTTATAGQTTFSIPSYTVGYLNVYQNGVRLGAADFTATNGTTVVLTVAAALNDLITTESFYVSSVTNAIPAVAGAVNSTYITDAAVTQQKLGSNVAGNGPAFSAYRGTSTQSISSLTFTKIQFNVEEFDTNNSYDNTTNYRFQPTVAGYYQITLSIYSTTGAAANFYSYIYKNGTNFKTITHIPTGGGGTSCVLNGTALVYLNGSTDYIEGYYYVSQAATVPADAAFTYLQGSLVRAA